MLVYLDNSATTRPCEAAVAAAIQGGSADAGMGIASAAAAMGLDFIEVGPEEYDFAIPVRFLSLPHVKRFLETLGSSEFRKRVEQLGGYGTSKTGQILYLDEVKE